MREALKLAKLKKEVSRGGAVPPGWRMAWYEPRRRVGVYFPPPLNCIMWLLRELRYRWHIAVRAPRIEAAQFFAMQRCQRQRQRMADEYASGYMAGWHECFQTCVEAIEDELHKDDVWDVGALLTDTGNPLRPDN